MSNESLSETKTQHTNPNTQPKAPEPRTLTKDQTQSTQPLKPNQYNFQSILTLELSPSQVIDLNQTLEKDLPYLDAKNIIEFIVKLLKDSKIVYYNNPAGYNNLIQQVSLIVDKYQTFATEDEFDSQIIDNVPDEVFVNSTVLSALVNAIKRSARNKEKQKNLVFVQRILLTGLVNK
jgi:hypothetical protein